MSTEKNLRNLFLGTQETLDDARKKFSDESRKSTKYFRFTQDGTYRVRILPLAPDFDADGNPVMPRKGYEWPIRELLLKIKGKDAKGKDKNIMVSVCNAKQRFTEKLENDPIELYVNLVAEKYPDDEDLIKKLRGSSFNGGLRFDSKRCMYVYDINKRGDGLQILKLTFPQYKEVEERKISLWEKLLKKNPDAGCPISSIDDACPLEIVRSTENNKTNYTFTIDNVDTDGAELSEDELQGLIDAPRIPEVIYRYSRFHLEATIAFLQQCDETFQLDIMEEDAMKDCIDQIKMLLPADDTSHFSISGNAAEGESKSSSNTLDSLWEAYDQIVDAGLDDKSEEGQDLRASIMEFIEENGLDIKPSRRDTNHDLLNDIEELIGEDAEKSGEETKKVEKEAPKDEDEDDDKEPARPARRGREEQNDDTAEPAAPRRSGRPARRR